MNSGDPLRMSRRDVFGKMLMEDVAFSNALDLARRDLPHQPPSMVELLSTHVRMPISARVPWLHIIGAELRNVTGYTPSIVTVQLLNWKLDS